MAPLKCCVGGCNATSDSHRLFSLPKDDNLRKLWLSFLVPTNPLLVALSKEQLLGKRVCHQHFERRQFDGHGRRTRYSYPSLFTSKEISLGCPLSTEDYCVQTEHNYYRKCEETEDDNSINESSLVIQTSDETHLLEHSYASCSSAQVNKEQTSIEFKVPTNELPSCSFDETNVTETSHFSTLIQKVPSNDSPSSSFSKTNVAEALHMPALKQKGASITKLDYKRKKIIRQAKKIINKSSSKSNLERLDDAQSLSKDIGFFKNFELLSKQAKTFIILQLKLATKKKSSRRFNFDEKLIALSLMKQSPKGYRLLEKMFNLPTKRTLNRLSHKISFEPGINEKVLKYLQEKTNNWETKKKLCTITFDEVALSPHLTFDESKDIIDGFVELGGGERKHKFCDHALVFMVRGICSPWRQSIAYYFCEGTVPAAELVPILRDVVTQVAQAGLLPLGLLCDQGSTFRTALLKIRQDTIRSRAIQEIRDDGTIELAGLNLNIFYDPPHLLKSIRNNFLTKDMLFDGKTGSWNDIMLIFDIDSKLGHTRALPKLTAHHVVPNKIKKMKVSAATQVLSARTAVMLKFIKAAYEHNNSISTSSTMTATAEIVEFFDNLFDSVNGSPGSTKRGKLRSAFKQNSPHLKFWQEAIQKLKAMKFIDTNSKLAIQAGKHRFIRVPCLDGWITTLESFIRMSKLLIQVYGVEYYYPRCVNQDPLENFFGRIRAVNYRNINPDAHTFINTFKSLVLSSIISPHSRFSNCEEDDGETIIDLNFMFQDETSNKENSFQTSTLPSSSSQNIEADLNAQVAMEKIKVQCSAYAAGYICRRLTKSFTCKKCIKTYTSTDVNSIHSFIQYREYKALKHNNLAYPNENFLRLYRQSSEIVHSYLNAECHKKNVGKNLRNLIRENLLFSWLGCEIHRRDVTILFLDIIIRMQVHNWCKIINKILKGEIDEKYAMKMGEIQKMAYRKYVKIRLRRKVLLK